MLDDHVRRWFHDTLSHWEIAPPEDDIARRRPGHIFKNGWHIGYAWGERDGEEFFDVLWEHRHPGQAVVRIHASGLVEAQEAISTTIITDTPDPQEVERARQRMQERNKRVAADLRERGLLPPVGEGMAFSEINEYLGTHGSGDE